MQTCIDFQGGKDKNGYGWQRAVGERKAHRVAYVKAYGPIQKGKWILHKCNNPSCVNPEHLYEGTPQQNSDDRVLAGNHNGWKGADQRGERNTNATLTEADVKNIRAVYKRGMGPTLAKQYGVIPVMINRIIRGEAWKSVL